MGGFDGFIQRGNVLPKHLHDATEICDYPNGLRFFTEASKFGFHLVSVL
jgi:hypothetical protein